MIDIKLIRHNPEIVAQSLAKRNYKEIDLNELISLDKKYRQLQVEVDELKNKRNYTSEKISQIKKKGEDITELTQQMKELGTKIKLLDDEMKIIDQKREETLLRIPNILDESVPIGKDANDNVEIRRWGDNFKPDYPIKPHEEIGLELDIMDFERASKLSGSRFVIMKGLGATLERALINFMLDLHIKKHGYTEILPPFIVNYDTMLANSNLPKFKDDLFKLENSNYYLIPTSEVCLSNIYRKEILESKDLPKYFVSYTPCFRSEAGAAGKDTKGLIRLHQFSKVEMVKIVTPDKSSEELENLVKDAEEVLQLLELPYRVVLLCSADMGFQSSKTYDLEVWFPSQEKYREISSCSNCTDFQSRRGSQRYRPYPKAKPDFPHILNGSGVAIGRTIAAILENHQQKDGSIKIPKILQSYLGEIKELKNECKFR